VLSGNGIIFQTPDVLTVSYIKDQPNFSMYCDKQLKDIGISLVSRTTACKVLKDSANNDPPTSFSNMNSIGGDFDKWARSKEYRGYIHIPSFNVKCDASGNLVTANPRDPDYRNKENPTKSPDQVDDAERNPYGYTKIPWYARSKCPNEYEPADVYTEDLTTSRLSNCSRYAQQELTGTDAPFIFTNINMKVCCNRQVSITIDRSVFPQTRLYIDGKMVGEQEQTDLGQFISSGGRQPDPSKLSKVGHGKIARSGKSLTYNKKVEKVIPA
ncbi:52_t:CDS:2, partial [Cetraspora pellucida]